MAIKGFVSYSHEDKKVCDALRKQLTILARLYDIDEFWVDDINTTGRCFRSGYQAAIDQASIFVLLISSNSLNSAEIMNREIPAILTRHKAAPCLILPAIVDECLWSCITGTTLASPRDDRLALKPILDWRPRDKGYARTGKQFSDAIGAHLGKAPKTLFDWTGP